VPRFAVDTIDSLTILMSSVKDKNNIIVLRACNGGQKWEVSWTPLFSYGSTCQI